MGGSPTFHLDALNGRIAPTHDVLDEVLTSQYRTFVSFTG